MKMPMIAFNGVAAGVFAIAAACGTVTLDSSAAGGDVTDRNADARVTWQEPIEVATGGGHRGPWRMNRSEWDFVDDATVAVNNHGFVGVAWAYHEQQDILFQLYDPDGRPRFDEPVNVSRSPRIFSWLPRMIITDGEEPENITVHLLWQEIVFSGGSHGGEIFFARSTDGGASFNEPINLSNTTAGAGKGRLTSQRWHNGSYDIIRNKHGHLLVAWTEYEGNLWFSRSTNDGERFSEPMHVFGGDDRNEPPARGPTLAAHNDRVLLAWTVGEEASANIHLAASDDGGRTFDAPRTVHERDGHADAPKLAVDGGGTVHLVYGESPDGPFRQYHVRHARASVDDLSFSESRDISGDQPGRFASIHFPMLRLDQEDNLYLTWELFTSPRGRPDRLAFTLLDNGGETLTRPVYVPVIADSQYGFSGSQQGLLMSKLAVNATGDIAVVNSTFRRGDSSRVWLIRGTAAKPDEK